MIKALVLLSLCIIRNAGVVGSNPIGGTISPCTLFGPALGLAGLNPAVQQLTDYSVHKPLQLDQARLARQETRYEQSDC